MFGSAGNRTRIGKVYDRRFTGLDPDKSRTVFAPFSNANSELF